MVEMTLGNFTGYTMAICLLGYCIGGLVMHWVKEKELKKLQGGK